MTRQISPTVQRLHTQFRFYGRNAREWMRKCVLMLPGLERERVWEMKGFGSLSEYASRLSGMSKETVNDGLRILKAVEGMPEIMKVIEKRGINCVKPIVTLLTHDNQKFWAEKVGVMSQHTLQMYRRELDAAKDTSAADIIGRGAPSEIVNFPQQKAIEIGDYEGDSLDIPDDERSTKPSVSSTKILAMQLRPEIIEQLEKLNGEDGDWNSLIEELLLMREKVLNEQKPPEKVTESRHIPAAIEQFVIERSRGVCEVGACAKKYQILHHVQRFASEKSHDPDKIIALCIAHERLVHLGLIEDESITPRKWKILEEADRNDKKYEIDQLVQKYRRPG